MFELSKPKYKVYLEKNSVFNSYVNDTVNQVVIVHKMGDWMNLNRTKFHVWCQLRTRRDFS